MFREPATSNAGFHLSKKAIYVDSSNGVFFQGVPKILGADNTMRMQEGTIILTIYDMSSSFPAA